MDDVVPRLVRPDDGDVRPFAEASLLESGCEACDHVGRLPDAPLLAGDRVHQGEPVRVATRRREEGARRRIVGCHEAEAAFAAIAA